MILVDNAVDSKHGYREALESITTKRNNQRIIALFLDCIAKGDQYYIVNKNEESLAEEIALELRSHGMQANSIKQNSYLDELLENYIYIISAKKDKDGDLYVDNTRSGKDNKINSKNLGVLSNILKKVNEKYYRNWFWHNGKWHCTCICSKWISSFYS